MHAISHLDDARVLLDWAQRTGADRFTRRDAHQANRARWPSPEDVDEPLRILVLYGWLTEETQQSGPRGGRPTTVFNLKTPNSKPQNLKTPARSKHS